MSVSMYQSQVTRLSRDLASHQSKLSGAIEKSAKADAAASKAAIRLSESKSASELKSRARDLERKQAAAVAASKKVTDAQKKLVQCEKRLSDARTKLDKAQRGQQKKDDREAENRRKADRDHLRELERKRRALASFPVIESTAVRDLSVDNTYSDSYDVCLSFAGEQRAYVEMIAAGLKENGLKVFYDADDEVRPKMWGKDLGDYLDYIYRKGSRYCLLFVSADYKDKLWTNHERKSALARAMKDSEYVLPVRFDDTELPGLRPTVGYVDLREIAPETLVDLVMAKLGEPSQV